MHCCHQTQTSGMPSALTQLMCDTNDIQSANKSHFYCLRNIFEDLIQL